MHIMHILHINMLNRARLCWTLCVFIGPTTTRVTLCCIPPSWSDIHNTRVICVSHRCHLCLRNCSRPIARIWCLCAFQLRMDNIWFCKLLLLFKIYTKTDAGMQYQECAYVSVLEEYKGPWKSGQFLHILIY